MKECAPTTTTSSSTTTTTVGWQVPCNECDPPLHDAYAVTFAGLGGPLSYLNGTHIVPWLQFCRWQLLVPGEETCPDESLQCAAGNVRLEWLEGDPGFWRAWAACGGGAVKAWKRGFEPERPCDLVGSYLEDYCIEYNAPCWPPLLFCAESNGATCVVSEIE